MPITASMMPVAIWAMIVNKTQNQYSDRQARPKKFT